MCCLTGSTRYFHVLVAALHKGCKSKLLAEGRFSIAKEPIKPGGLFYAGVDDELSLSALAMPLVGCSRENRLFGI